MLFNSLQLFSQSKFDALDFYYLHFVYTQSFGGYPENQAIADSISDILDSIGIVNYEKQFKKVEKKFRKDLDKVLTFDPYDTDSTNKYLNICQLNNSSYFLKLHTKELLPYCYDLNNYIQRNILVLLDISQ